MPSSTSSLISSPAQLIFFDIMTNRTRNMLQSVLSNVLLTTSLVSCVFGGGLQLFHDANRPGADIEATIAPVPHRDLHSSSDVPVLFMAPHWYGYPTDAGSKSLTEDQWEDIDASNVFDRVRPMWPADNRYQRHDAGSESDVNLDKAAVTVEESWSTSEADNTAAGSTFSANTNAEVQIENWCFFNVTTVASNVLVGHSELLGSDSDDVGFLAFALSTNALLVDAVPLPVNKDMPFDFRMQMPTHDGHDAPMDAPNSYQAYPFSVVVALPELVGVGSWEARVVLVPPRRHFSKPSRTRRYLSIHSPTVLLTCSKTPQTVTSKDSDALTAGVLPLRHAQRPVPLYLRPPVVPFRTKPIEQVGKGTRYDFGAMLEREGMVSGVEIGVWRGAYAGVLIAHWPSCERLLLVDAWTAWPTYNDTVNRQHTIGQPLAQIQFEQDHSVTYKRMQDKISEGVVEVLRQTSMSASGLVDDSSVDFIYIDARHDFESVLLDMHTWWPKLRGNGIMAGHDYITAEQASSIGAGDWTVGPDGTRDPHGRATREAVDHFARIQGRLPVITSSESGPGDPVPSWLIRKPK